MCNGILFTVAKISPRPGLELGLSRPALNPLSYRGLISVCSACVLKKDVLSCSRRKYIFFPNFKIQSCLNILMLAKINPEIDLII